jgi:sialic acid synthase SpsE
MKNKPLIICEIGLNHLGSKKELREYTEFISKKDIYGATIQILKDSFYEKFNNLKIDNDSVINFIKELKVNNKKVGLAIDDVVKVDIFKDEKIDFYKVLNKDIHNSDLINKLISTKKKVFISTGDTSFKDIRSTLKKIDTKNIKLIHTRFGLNSSDVNFNNIIKLKESFDISVSYGNHSPYLEAIAASVFFDPEFIFFYIKNTKNNKNIIFPDNDHAVNLESIDKIIYDIKILNNMR